jgi:hypothetical protein
VARPLLVMCLMDTHAKIPEEPEPKGPCGVPVDAPDNEAPAISPPAVSRMPRAEDDEIIREHSRDFSDDAPPSATDRRR